MADQWFYRMFGEEFGPVSLEQLRELAEQGTVSADDEIRATNSNAWVLAGSVSALGLATASTATTVAATSTSGSSADVGTIKGGLDDWYCHFHGSELGPLSFDELVKFAEHEHLTADDEVKLGANGKWRRVGSIGRLMAVLPYQIAERTTPPPASRGTAPVVEQPVLRETPPPPTVSPAETALRAAQQQLALAQTQAQELTAWAFAPNVDPYWWGFIGGMEYGPGDFRQIMNWVTAGQLQPTDFVRNGLYGQYVPAANVPGLFAAANMLAQATTALQAAEALAASATAAPTPQPTLAPVAKAAVSPSPIVDSAAGKPTAPTPAKPVESAQPSKTAASTTSTIEASARAKSDAAVTTKPDAAPTEAKPAAIETPVKPVVTTPPPAASSSPSTAAAAAMMSGSSFATARPAPAPIRPAPKPTRSSGGSSFSMSDSLEFLKDPKALGALGVLALILLVMGWQYLPISRGADVKHYHALKHLIDEIHLKRTNKSTDLTAIVSQAERLSKEITLDLKDKASANDRAKQYLLWAARDDLPRMMAEIQKTPLEASIPEKTYEERLREAAKVLGMQ